MIHPSLHNGPAFANKRIGLLGGSFNPAHEGHVEISAYALKRFQLDQVWWLVSPQNPLKHTDGMANLKDRVRKAKKLTKDAPHIAVTTLESELGTRYTIDTVRALKKHMPETHFVWLMGADNLLQIEKWHQWESLFNEIPIAVFRRPGHPIGKNAGKAACHFASALQKTNKAHLLALQTPPAWLVLNNKGIALSATQLRKQKRGS